MDVNLALVLPATFDIVHVGLAGLSGLLLLLLLLLLVFIVSRKSNSVQVQDTEFKRTLQPETDHVENNKSRLQSIDGEGALQLLSILQSQGRLVDFICENMAEHSDADIGAAVRVVHKGLRQAFDEHFDVAAIVPEEEGDSITVPEGFKPSEIQLLGQVTGAGPFKGTLVHQGWRVTDVRLPKVVEGRDSYVLAPAQVEL